MWVRGKSHCCHGIKMQQSVAQMETSIRKQNQKPKSVLTFCMNRNIFNLTKKYLFLTFSKALG